MNVSFPPIDQLTELADDLAVIAEQARLANSPIGYFAALYRRTTAAIGAAISAGTFDDPSTVGRLAVTFGNRYLGALSAWSAGASGPTLSRAWQVAFEAAAHRDLLVIEHILLGMNAHILLDLGVAAADVCPGDEIHRLHGDFNRVNAVLGALVDPMRLAVSRVERWLIPFNKFGHLEDLVADLGVNLARRSAWEVALHVASAAPDGRAARIATVDADVARLSELLITPRRGLPGLLLRLARRLDDDQVGDEMDALAG